MNQSEAINELVTALAKAQGKMKPAVFNKVNPHFKNRYADFTAIMDACRLPLSENGLSVMQYCETIGDKLTLVTMLAHTSGQWIKSQFPLNPIQQTSQAIGSAMTYGKRYCLSSMLGIVSEEDDDGEAASHGDKTLTSDQIAVLKKIEKGLPDFYKTKLTDWLQRSYKTKNMEEISQEYYDKIFIAYDNARKTVIQEEAEVKNA
jgi:hypothetical protein